jgi:hypothetical protein
MFVHKAMTALAETCGSVSFALPGARFHCVLDIIATSGDIRLRAKVLGEGRAFEGDVHRAESIEEMKKFLRDEGNEEQVRFAIRQLWNRIEGRK